MPINTYTKRPVSVQAMRYVGNRVEAMKWLEENNANASIDGDGIAIKTLEGVMRVSLGDYIIKGTHGEMYPCKEDIFLETYERVVDYSGWDAMFNGFDNMFNGAKK